MTVPFPIINLQLTFQGKYYEIPNTFDTNRDKSDTKIYAMLQRSGPMRMSSIRKKIPFYLMSVNKSTPEDKWAGREKKDPT